MWAGSKEDKKWHYFASESKQTNQSSNDFYIAIFDLPWILPTLVSKDDHYCPEQKSIWQWLPDYKF